LAQPPQGSHSDGIGVTGLSGLGSQSRPGEHQQAANLEKSSRLGRAMFAQLTLRVF
jgi:hypothetical protein